MYHINTCESVAQHIFLLEKAAHGKNGNEHQWSNTNIVS